MDQTNLPTRYTLRDLPAAAKLVVACFLIAVGVGYFSAMVQIHMKHSQRNGEALPTQTDLIEKFSGLKLFDGNYPKSKIETIVSGETHGAFDKENMTPAFFEKSGSRYSKDVTKRGKEVVDAERTHERDAFLAWINMAPEARKQAYMDDSMPLPETLIGKPITEDYFDPEKKVIKIFTLIDERCVKCHGGDQLPELLEYPQLEPLITAPKQELIDGKWVRSQRQMSVEGLTQSTHAHLLSFAMLFSLTGLITAFTSYPGLLRILLAPIVLIAQVSDVACWWLARLDGVGPFFAQAVMATGAVVGVGLLLQIILSLFNMYGWKGKIVLLLILLAGLAGFAVLFTQVIDPALQTEQADFLKKAN